MNQGIVQYKMERKELAIDKQCLTDFEDILSHRYDNGADYWITPDKRPDKRITFQHLLGGWIDWSLDQKLVKEHLVLFFQHLTLDFMHVAHKLSLS